MCCLVLLLVLLTLGANAFTLVVLPDTQYYSAWRPVLFEQQVNWICACAQPLGIDFVSHVGDVVEHGTSTKEWTIASYATSCLNDRNIPFAFTVGNHDDDFVSDQFDYANSRFHSPMDSEHDIVYRVEGHAENNYIQFAQQNLLIMHIQWHASQNVTDWAIDVLNQNVNRSVILVSHFVLNDCSDHVSADVRHILEHTCNVKLVLGGHVFRCGGENHRTLTDNCGNQVPIMTQDYQARENGGDSWLRYYEIDEETSVFGESFCAYTYNVHRNRYETDANSHFRFQNGSFERPGCALETRCAYRYSQGGVYLIHLLLYAFYSTIVLVAVYRMVTLVKH